MSNIAYNNNPNHSCVVCLHAYSLLHFSDDIHGVGSNNFKDIHTGCMYVNLLTEANVPINALDHHINK